MEVTKTRPWLQRGLINGLFAGAVTNIWLLLFFLYDREIALSSPVLLATYVFYLYFMYRAAAVASADDFRSYIRPAFLVFVVANALYYIYYYFLFTRIDPGLIDLQAERLAAEGLLEDIGGRDSLAVTATGTLWSFMSSLLGGFGLSVVIALALRNR